MPSAQASPSDRIVVLVCLVMSGVAFLSLGDFPRRYVEFQVLGSPLGLSLSGRWLAGGLLIGLVALGMNTLVRELSGHARLDLRYLSTFWILPGLVTLAAAASVPRLFGQVGPWLGSLVFLALLLAVVVVAECGTVRLDSGYYRRARLALNVATYAAALALYASIYGLQVRSLLSSTAIVLVTFPLALELLRSTEEQFETAWLYAAIIALVVGEVSWPLNALGLSGLFGGAAMLLVFYSATGIVQQSLAERLNRRVLTEFALVGGLALLLIVLGSRPGPASTVPGLGPASGELPPLDLGHTGFGFDAPPIPMVPILQSPPAPLIPVNPWTGERLIDESPPPQTGP